MARPLSILFVQQEMKAWTSARMWGYNCHLGLEEGFLAHGVEVTTLMSTWMPWARELVGDRTFDQVWFNDCTHQFEVGGWEDGRLTFRDREWLASLAPVRVGVLIESLRYRDEEYAEHPWLHNAYNVISLTLPYLTHVLHPDEKDETWIRRIRPIPTLWYPFYMPARLIVEAPSLPPRTPPVFFGTPYGERAKWLADHQLKEHLVHRLSKDNATDLPARFEALHQDLPGAIQAHGSVQAAYGAYLEGVRHIRREAYRLFMESWLEGCAVVSLPPFGKVYTGAVYEGFCLGRPVVAMGHPANTLQNLNFIEGEDLLVYPREDPGILAAHIRRLQQDPELGLHLARNACAKMRNLHTTERRMAQYLAWIETGAPPSYLQPP